MDNNGLDNQQGELDDEPHERWVIHLLKFVINHKYKHSTHEHNLTTTNNIVPSWMKNWDKFWKPFCSRMSNQLWIVLMHCSSSCIILNLQWLSLLQTIYISKETLLHFSPLFSIYVTCTSDLWYNYTMPLIGCGMHSPSTKPCQLCCNQQIKNYRRCYMTLGTTRVVMQTTLIR